MAFTNRDRLRRKMKAIPVHVRKAARAQLKANALQLAEQQRRFVPIDEMKLHDSIKAVDVSDSTRMTWKISAGNRQVPYAAWVEFGTAASAARPSRQNMNYRRTVVMTRSYAAHHATEPRPFFWVSYRLLKNRFKRRMTTAAKKAIAEATR